MVTGRPIDLLTVPYFTSVQISSWTLLAGVGHHFIPASSMFSWSWEYPILFPGSHALCRCSQPSWGLSQERNENKGWQRHVYSQHLPQLGSSRLARHHSVTPWQMQPNESVLSMKGFGSSKSLKPYLVGWGQLGESEGASLRPDSSADIPGAPSVGCPMPTLEIPFILSFHWSFILYMVMNIAWGMMWFRLDKPWSSEGSLGEQ